MLIEAKDYLELCKATGKLFTWDIEATGLKCDYNSVLCVTIKPYGQEHETYRVKQPGNDEKLVREVIGRLNEAKMWLTFYGKGFDVPMVRGRSIKWRGKAISSPVLVKQPHIDLFFQIVGKVNTARKSLAHICRWLNLPDKKMDVGPDEWNRILYETEDVMTNIMIPRNVSDVLALETALEPFEDYIINITR